MSKHTPIAKNAVKRMKGDLVEFLVTVVIFTIAGGVGLLVGASKEFAVFMSLSGLGLALAVILFTQDCRCTTCGYMIHPGERCR